MAKPTSSNASSNAQHLDADYLDEFNKAIVLLLTAFDFSFLLLISSHSIPVLVKVSGCESISFVLHFIFLQFPANLHEI
jgi:hypothetical protein